MCGERSAEVNVFLLTIENFIVVSAIPIQKNRKIFAVRLASFSETMYAYKEKYLSENDLQRKNGGLVRESWK